MSFRKTVIAFVASFVAATIFVQYTLGDMLGVSAFESLYVTFGMIPSEIAVPFLLFVGFLIWLNPSSA